MYEVLDESLRRAEINHNITYGIFTPLLLKSVVVVIQILPSATYPDLFFYLQQYCTSV